MSMFDLLDDFEASTRNSHHSRYAATQPASLSLRDSGYSINHLESQRLPQLDFDPEYAVRLPLDEFDQQLLRQPHVDRRGLAEQGAARLTLPPVSTNPYNHASQSRRFDDATVTQHLRHQRPEPALSDLSRFAYQGDALCKSSSPDAASSPMLKASQRRFPPVPQTRQHSGPRSQTSIFGAQREDIEGPPRTLQRRHTDEKYQDTPVVQGIQLVPRSALPDRFRTIFPFPIFNAVQSKSFHTVFGTNDNYVLSSPTGSGKTAVLELAICRAVNQLSSGEFKIVYQAPTKALCSERQRDWEAKFGPLGLQCAELTGDTEHSQLLNVQKASILITTPEKWDSLTRKWKDHEKLMRLVKLFLIDEVHILKDDRGATLEAVVSRMRTVGANVRFVALSATVPNAEDIATWFGRNQDQQHDPAVLERFGEEFRPVILQKHVRGFAGNGNDFQFDSTLSTKLPDIIKQYSEGKPIMIFCTTRKMAETTANQLAQWWASQAAKDKYWPSPKRSLHLQTSDLRAIASSGVAFHHAGIEADDRIKIEKAYLEGELHVICCTSTLAVGVNLPCHLVIIKNTVTWTQTGSKEYADLEVMQMLGRAGRPQFDKTGVAVIMTRNEKIKRYEKMVSGEEVLESKLHLNLIEHLNAEICLGTITSPTTATKWLAGTFLFVRLAKNPAHYRMEGCSATANADDILRRICRDNTKLLYDHDLIKDTSKLSPTEFGNAMARYYVQFETMKLILGLEPKAKISEILSVIAQAEEFKEVRFRGGDKGVYKGINKHAFMRMPIQVDLALPGHKVSLIIQMALGGIEWPNDNDGKKFRHQYTLDHAMVFRHLNRLIHCVIDCLLVRNDAIAVRSAFMLERSIGAQAWEDSPMQMQQLQGIGPVAMRKLVQKNVTSLEDLENTEAHSIESIIGKNPPFGMRLLEKLKTFPKLRVSIKLLHHEALRNNGVSEGVKVQVQVDLGFLNDKVPIHFEKKRVSVCLLAERSDGLKVHFARASASNLSRGQNVRFGATLNCHDETITCSVMCEEIAGSLRQATLKHMLPAAIFPTRSESPDTAMQRVASGSNTSKRRVGAKPSRRSTNASSDEFRDTELGDDDFANLLSTAAASDETDFLDIDDAVGAVAKSRAAKPCMQRTKNLREEDDTGVPQPVKLSNGKWKCNHRCKNPLSCKHMCCREGMDKPPKATAKRPAAESDTRDASKAKVAKKAGTNDAKQSKLNMAVTEAKDGRQHGEAADCLDLTQRRPTKAKFVAGGPRELRKLQSLHNNAQEVTGSQRKSPLVHNSQPALSYSAGHKLDLSFLKPQDEPEAISSDYGDIDMDDELPPLATETRAGNDLSRDVVTTHSDDYGSLFEGVEDEQDLVVAALVDYNDSEDLREERHHGVLEQDNFGLDETIFEIYEDGEAAIAEPSVNVADESQAVGEIAAREKQHNETSKSLFVTGFSSSSRLSGVAGIGSDNALQQVAGLTSETLSTSKENERPAAADLPESPPAKADPPRSRAKSISIPPGWEGIDPSIFQEFGAYVEFV